MLEAMEARLTRGLAALQAKEAACNLDDQYWDWLNSWLRLLAEYETADMPPRR